MELSHYMIISAVLDIDCIAQSTRQKCVLRGKSDYSKQFKISIIFIPKILANFIHWISCKVKISTVVVTVLSLLKRPFLFIIYMKTPVVSGSLRAHCVRLHPGDDLISGILDAAKETGESACFILTCVGSLEEVTLRMAHHRHPEEVEEEDNCNISESNNTIKSWKECLEIVSLVGTLSPQMSAKHLHISLSDRNGSTIGGHLISGRVFTTMELVLGSVDRVMFSREYDPDTGYQELTISSKNPSEDVHIC
jgi:uncharacterized protein